MQHSALDLLFGNQQRIGTPGFNPNAKDPRPDVPPNPLDKFIGSPGGSLLINLLSQSGFSPVPQSPLGALGRGLLQTQQQGQQRQRSFLEDELLRSRIRLVGKQASGELNDPDSPSDVRRFEFFESLGNLKEPDKLTAAQKRFLEVQRTQPQFNVPGAGFGGVSGGEFTPSVPETTIVGGIEERKETEAAASVRGSRGATRIEDLPKTVQAAEQTIRGIDNVIDEVSRGLKLVGPASTGALGSLLSFIPGTDAFSLGKIRQTIKSNIGFDRLNEMRRVSPTGASGLGQLSTIELDGLQNGLTNLDQAQLEGDVKRALMKVLSHYERWKQIMEQHKFDEQRRAGVTDALPPGFSEVE